MELQYRNLKNLKKYCGEKLRRLEWIEQKVATVGLRTVHTNVVRNMVTQTKYELNMIVCHATDDIMIMSSVTRNLFEILIALKYVGKSDPSRWVSAMFYEDREILRDFRKMGEALSSKNGSDQSEAISIFDGEIQRIEQAAIANSVKIMPGLKIREMAVIAKMESEHDHYYKLYSNLVHPGSWQINKGQTSLGVPAFKNIIYVKLQEYMDAILEIVDIWKKPNDN